MVNSILGAAQGGPDRSNHFNQWIGVYIAAALSVLVGVAGWSANEMFQMHDIVTGLATRVPIQLDAINGRLSSMELRQNVQDERLYELEKTK